MLPQNNALSPVDGILFRGTSVIHIIMSVWLGLVNVSAMPRIYRVLASTRINMDL